MKKNTLLFFFLLSLLLGITINSSGQTTIWSEDFSAYVENTGIEGPGTVNIGDYPAGVTKWTLDVSNCTLADADDYFKTHNYAKQLEGRDLDGSAVWQSELIDISSYSAVTFSLEASEDGSLNSSDYFDVFYQVDGGNFIRIPNWNGMGNDDHTLVDDFPSTTITQSISSGNQLVIKVVMHNNSMWDRHYLDDITVKADMEYVSSTTTQNTLNIAAGKTNRQIIGIEITTTGTESPLSISSFMVNANGSSTPISTNIENAKIFYTGTSNTFTTDTQFGSTYTSPTTTNFDITGTQQLSEGTNYFWLTFDTKTTAILGELIDAECISFVIGGSTENPTITAPADSRIIAEPLSGSYTIGAKSNYSSFTAAANDLNELGISGTVSFAVASGTYTEQISLTEIDGTSATDTIVFQSSTGNRADVVLQYEPTSDLANYILKFDGTDYITFQNMILKNVGTSAYGRVIVFTGATNNINITGCNMNGRDFNHENNVDYTVITGEGGTSNMASNIIFDNDTIRYGSYGLNFNGGDNNNLETDIRISNSVFEDFYYAGIFLYYQDSVVVHSNKLTGKGVYDYEYGMFLMYCYGGYEITANMVFLSAEVVNSGIRLLECHASATRYALVANNYFSQVSTGGAYGIDVSDCSYQKIYHNSINMRSSAKSGKDGKFYSTVGCYFDCGASASYGFIAVLNNIIKSAKKAILVTPDAVNQSYLANSDHNVYYVQGSEFGNWGNEPVVDLADWKDKSGLDGVSVDVDPGYYITSSPNYAEETIYATVPLTVEVSGGIYGETRNDPTSPGAVPYDNFVDNVWLGTETGGDWNDSNNWNLEEVPEDNHYVVIPPGTPYSPVLTVDAECFDITLQDNLDLGVFDVSIGHDVTIDGGSFASASTGVLSLVGPDGSNLTSGGQSIYEVSVDKDPDVPVVLKDPLNVTDLDVNSGILNADFNDIEISGSTANLSGGSVINTSTVEFTSPNTVQFNPGNNTFNNLGFSGGGIYDILAKLVAEGDFTASGTINFNGHDQEFGGDVDLSNCNYNIK